MGPSPESDGGIPKCLIGVPAAFVTLTQFWARLYMWIQGQLVDISVCEGNRVEMNRSAIIGQAREVYRRSGIQSPNLPPLLMLDTDVVVKIPIGLALALYEDDLAQGFDIICSPTRRQEAAEGASQSLFIAKKSPVGLVQSGRPFEVEASAFGMVFMSPRVVLALQPLRRFRYVDGREVDVFCDFSRTSEDYDLCLRARELGYRVCCDPRMLTDHLKTVAISSWLGPSISSEPPAPQGEAMNSTAPGSVSADANPS